MKHFNLEGKTAFISERTQNLQVKKTIFKKRNSRILKLNMFLCLASYQQCFLLASPPPGTDSVWKYLPTRRCKLTSSGWRQETLLISDAKDRPQQQRHFRPKGHSLRLHIEPCLGQWSGRSKSHFLPESKTTITSQTPVQIIKTKTFCKQKSFHYQLTGPGLLGDINCLCLIPV